MIYIFRYVKTATLPRDDCKTCFKQFSTCPPPRPSNCTRTVRGDNIMTADDAVARVRVVTARGRALAPVPPRYDRPDRRRLPGAARPRSRFSRSHAGSPCRTSAARGSSASRTRRAFRAGGAVVVRSFPRFRVVKTVPHERSSLSLTLELSRTNARRRNVQQVQWLLSAKTA